MLSKNNRQLQQEKYGNHKQRFHIAKSALGVLSVLIGLSFAGGGTALADNLQNTQDLQPVLSQTVVSPPQDAQNQAEPTNSDQGVTVTPTQATTDVSQQTDTDTQATTPVQATDEQPVGDTSVNRATVASDGTTTYTDAQSQQTSTVTTPTIKDDYALQNDAFTAHNQIYSADSSSIENVDGYVTADSWYRPKDILENRVP